MSMAEIQTQIEASHDPTEINQLFCEWAYKLQATGMTREQADFCIGAARHILNKEKA